MDRQINLKKERQKTASILLSASVSLLCAVGGLFVNASMNKTQQVTTATGSLATAAIFLRWRTNRQITVFPATRKIAFVLRGRCIINDVVLRQHCKCPVQGIEKTLRCKCKAGFHSCRCFNVVSVLITSSSRFICQSAFQLTAPAKANCG